MPPPDNSWAYSEPRWIPRADTTAAQLRQSLARQRAAGCSFDLAWLQAVQRLRLPHPHDERHDWYRLLADPVFIGWWRSAYLREPGPNQLVGALTAVLDSRPVEAGSADSLASGVTRRGTWRTCWPDVPVVSGTRGAGKWDTRRGVTASITAPREARCNGSHSVTDADPLRTEIHL